MPTTHTVTAYTFDELSPEAKERARTWMREGVQQDWDAEYILSDAAEICDLLGIELNTHAVKLHGGGTRHDPDIFYSGFYSQGDGASFTGTYAHKAGSRKAITAHAPQDTELHRIARELADLQKTYAYKLRATIRRISSHYSHEHTVCVDAELDTENPEWTVTPADEETLTEALRDLMRWIYKGLQQEYEYRLADAQIDEDIRANEYAFSAEGSRRVTL